MGMQYSSVQSPYSSAPQGKGQGLPNPEAQMSPNPPRMDAQQEMMRRFPQNGGIMKPQNMMQTGGFRGPMKDGSVQSEGPNGERTGGMPMGGMMGGPGSYDNSGINPGGMMGGLGSYDNSGINPGGMSRPAKGVPNYNDVVDPMHSPQTDSSAIGIGPSDMFNDSPTYTPGPGGGGPNPPFNGGMGNVYRGEMTGGAPTGGLMSYGNTGVVGPNKSQGKGMGSQGAITFPSQGGQPKIGQPNAYPNTINSSDNTGMFQPRSFGGKSKGAR